MSLPFTYHLSPITCYLAPVTYYLLKTGEGHAEQGDSKNGISQRVSSFGLGIKQKAGNLPSCSICGPGPEVASLSLAALGRGFQNKGSEKNDHETKMSPACRVLSHPSLKRDQHPVSAGSFPAGCLIPGDSLGDCLLQQGAALHSRTDTRNADGVTSALPRRYGPELAVLQGGKS